MANKTLPSLLERHWAESALAIGAVFIAAASLWVAYDADITNRDLVTSASWPDVQIYSSDVYAGPHARAIYTDNAGIGPAKMETFELFWKGKPYRNTEQLLEACCGYHVDPAEKPKGKLPEPDSLETSTVAGFVLRPGQKIPFIIYRASSDDSATLKAFKAQYANFKYRICYCSVFNECWISDGHELNPQSVAACPVPKVAFQD